MKYLETALCLALIAAILFLLYQPFCRALDHEIEHNERQATAAQRGAK